MTNPLTLEPLDSVARKRAQRQAGRVRRQERQAGRVYDVVEAIEARAKGIIVDPDEADFHAYEDEDE